jgi:hypothetical protein
VSEKSKSTSPSAVQVKKWQKTTGIEELDIISSLEKSERIVDIMCNVGLAYSWVFTIHENADGINPLVPELFLKCLHTLYLKCE